MHARVSVNAHSQYLIATDAAAFAIGAVLLLLVSMIRSFLSPLAVAILPSSVIAAFTVTNGVRWTIQ